jgi:O-antigen/teichoic acid export membrane protein
MNRMNKIIKPILNRRLLIIGFGVALYFLVAQFFGYLVGLTANTLFFICVIFYIGRKDRRSVHRSNPINNRRAVNIGRYNAYETRRPKYVCLSCGALTKDAQCCECGSKIRKPLF